MTIEERLTAELNQALKDGRREVVDCIRMVKTRLAEKRTSPGFTGPMTDAVAQEVIEVYQKTMRKAIAELEAAGQSGHPLCAKYRFEVDYLASYLPRKLDEAATRDLVRRVAREQGLSGPSATGRLMGAVIKAHREEVDPVLVKRIVEEELRS